MPVTPSNQKVQFNRGLKSNLPEEKVPGTLSIATDTGEAFLDDTSTNRVQIKDTTKVSKSGDTMTGTLNMSSHKITNVADPTVATDAVNLRSVQQQIKNNRYSGDTSINVDNEELTISHRNIGTEGTVGPTGDLEPSHGGTIQVPSITTDAQGHVTSKQNRTITLPSVISDDQVKEAVNNYLEENPVSGMTSEQEQQLNQNTLDVSDLKSALTSATLGIENGLLYIFLNNQKVGEGISIGEINTPDIPIYEHVSWIDTAYGIGDNTIANYNAWAPGCAFYDSISKKVIFLQCHRLSHTGSWLKSQLWAIDPYNVMEGELLYEFDVDTYGNVPLAMTQDNGRIYIFSKNARWVSQDNGKTFEKTNIVTKPDHMYGVSLIDGVMYAGDDASDTAYNGYYWTSNDYGLNWECHTFEFTEEYGDELFCCEANFIKFKGKIYASLRRQDKNGLMAVLEDGVWKVISEEMPNVNSDSYFSVTEDRLCYASIDRPNRILYLGTCIPNETGVDIKKEKSFVFSNFTSEGDFHTPTYVYGNDFQMVTFMTGVGHSDYQKCMNACLVGYSDMELSENPNYEIKTFDFSSDNFTNEPYINSPITWGSNENFSELPAVANSIAHYANTWPLENGKIVFYFPVSSPIIGPDIYCTSNCYGYTIYDMVESNDKKYVCLVKGMGSSSELTGLKLMSKANKILYDVSEIGEITPSNGVFNNAIYAISNKRFFVGSGYRMYAKIS